ncbi:DgyrCDS3864 [Dimorphilus gyrociliatus]|uniref:Urocanate hydratase n=1 Tax=Dimorphilus gyrociliatus TaxID=2664684 RepID=A0A7I8VEX7_9ANNE|nr:DgyrCDS3864 [Dimorphilus gyrociliatus]
MEESDIKNFLKIICSGLPVDPLPPKYERDPLIAHAPKLSPNLNEDDTVQAISNALRYFPPETHLELGKEFLQELNEYGHIYMYRLKPQFSIKAYPINLYPVKTQKAAAIMHMLMNNLDPRVAQFPEELVTYGGNGQVLSNWAQFWLVLKYLSELEDDETLVLYSGHPLGVFPSSSSAPRLVITNGMMVPNYSNREDYEKLFALGVTMYGQMTAGSYCYIGPQGIVHGTTLTILNAGRKYLGLEDLRGKVFITSGLGGMSGAQAKAAVISGCIGVVAEVSAEAVDKRKNQGWVLEKTDDLDVVIAKIRQYRKEKKATSIAYLGNIVDLWERLVEEYRSTGELLCDLGSDQTSCHNPFSGGYYPAGLSFNDSRELLSSDPIKFRKLVEQSLVRQIDAINFLNEQGLKFWDYGNAFLLEASRAGAEVRLPGEKIHVFRYPSYVQHIMGDIFSLGFGPFRWVCSSADPQDLEITDKIAEDVLHKLMEKNTGTRAEQQYKDNIKWIQEAQKHKMVVGSQARILYSDQQGRIGIALAFNEAVANGRLKAPVILSRDHHDVSGTDSPFRETSNIYDGSALCADMAVQNAIGLGFRGATWVALHNGGGVGWGEVINGGFGLILDGSNDAAEKVRNAIGWDVANGVARRSWCGNENAVDTIRRLVKENSKFKITVPYSVDKSQFK